MLEGVGNLALGVPATAAGLGSFDYLTLVSGKQLGVPTGIGVPYVLTVHAMVVLPVTILGIVFVWTAFPRLFRTIFRREPTVEEQPVDAAEQHRSEAYREA